MVVVVVVVGDLLNVLSRGALGVAFVAGGGGICGGEDVRSNTTRSSSSSYHRLSLSLSSS